MATQNTATGGVPKRGSSGATLVDLGGGTIRKTGNKRVREQGEYILSLNTTLLPAVYSMTRDGYVMEKLDDPQPLRLLEADVVIDEYIYSLERFIWSQPAQVHYKESDHIAKMLGLVAGSTQDINLLELTHRDISFNHLKQGRTHGDCTMDNMMLRGSRTVIIDPIPPTGAVPDLVAVDRGKMMMSLVGFEVIRYGLPTSSPTSIDRAIHRLLHRDFSVSENERRAAVYFCAVHLYRAAPYMPSEEVGEHVRSLARFVLKTYF